ncbi:MAG: hypothetical protein IT279_10435 [Ignavibacteriaceae bacterium]|nr:hypothetical protein [Ignavibacteriaceae bacterium]
MDQRRGSGGKPLLVHRGGYKDSRDNQDSKDSKDYQDFKDSKVGKENRLLTPWLKGEHTECKLQSLKE